MHKSKHLILMVAVFVMLVPDSAVLGTVDQPEVAQSACHDGSAHPDGSAKNHTLFPGLAPSAKAAKIPEAMLPVLVQAMKDEIPQCYHIGTSVKGRLIANNPSQRLSFGFSNRGIEVSTVQGNRWGMHLLSYGFDGEAVPLEPVSPKGQGARVEYEHNGMTEWYINSPYGLEQGFTFKAPVEAKAKRLRLSFSLEGEVWQQGDSLVFSSKGSSQIRYQGLHAFDATGRSLVSGLALEGNRLGIEVDVTGAIYPVTVDPFFSVVNKLIASDASSYDGFGHSVGISGDTAVIGSSGNDDNGDGSGSAYVFVRNGTTWNEQQKLTASDGAEGDKFGYPVAISGDTVVIGAAGDDDNGDASGSAYVFVRNGTTWSQQQKLIASDGAAIDCFGYSVAVSGDTAVIGAANDDDNGNTSGSAYVFVRSGTTWNQQQKLTASDGAEADMFGCSVAVSGDTAVIGAERDDVNGYLSGSAYVFVRSGTTWSQQQKLTDSEYYARFGCSVAISGDTAVVGAYYDQGKYYLFGAGSAYVYNNVRAMPWIPFLLLEE
jgi:hypothetical protein